MTQALVTLKRVFALSQRSWLSGMIVVLLAIVGAVLFYGAYYPSGDDMALVPFLFRWNDPTLFQNDLAFSGGSQRFAFGLSILNGLSKVLPLKYATGLWIICSHACLLLGLWLIYQTLAEKNEARKGIIVLFVLLIVCGQDAITGSYYLQFHYWAPHYLAHPLVFIALFCLVTRRFMAMCGLLVLAICIHPLIGLNGAILCFGTLLLNRLVKLPRKQIMVVAVSAGLALAALCVIALRADGSHVRISAFVRAPWHMVPLGYAGALNKFITAALGFVLMGLLLCRSDERARSIFIAGLIAIFGILFGIWNNTTFAIPILVMANPLQLGPVLHGLFLCLAAVLIVRLAQSNTPYLIALPLLAPHKTGFYFIISVLAIHQLVVHAGLIKRKTLLFVISFVILLCAIGGSLMLFPDALSPWRSGCHYLLALVSAVCLIAMLSRAMRRGSPLVVSLVTVCIALFYLVYGLTDGQRFLKFDLAVQPAEPSLIDAAEFIEKNAARENVIVHPPAIGNFQYLSRRSSFVSFKTIPLTAKLLPEWFRRLQELGFYDKALDYRSLNETAIACHEGYYRLAAGDFIGLADRYPAISHIIFDKRQGDCYFLKLVYQNEHFSVRIPELQEYSVLAETVFPISFPETPVFCERLVGDVAAEHGWFAFGWEGDVSLQGVADQLGVMRLVAGVDWADRGRGHCLLLRPIAAHDQGIPVEPDAELVEFSCSLRSATPELSGRLLLRLDVKTQSEWVYVVGGKWVDLGEEWARHTVLIKQDNNIKAIGPIIEWHPGAKGDVLDVKEASIRWMRKSVDE